VRRLLALAVALSLAAAAVPARGDDTREVTFPRHAISLRVPSSWEIRQYGEDLARWTGEGFDVRLRVAAKPIDVADATEVVEGVRARRRAGTTGAGHGFELVVRTPDDDEARRRVADAVVQSLDLAPFPNPRLHVDWRRGWAIEVPDGWDLVPGAASARFAPRSGGCVLSVDAWEDLPAAKDSAGDLDARVALALRLAREERLGGETVAPKEEPEVAEVGVGAGVDGRLAGFRVATESMKARGEEGWVSFLVTTRFRLQVVCDATGKPASAAATGALRSFEPDTVGAGRRGAQAPPTDRFPGDAGPALVFRLPAGWRAGTPSSRMRLAQYEVPGDPPAEVAVFFFGAGQGGGVAANFDRWKGQVKDGSEPTTSVLDPVEGIRVHVLDARGTYASSGMPGAAPVRIEDARLLGAVVECPGGPVFVRALGPRATMDAAAPAVLDWLETFRIAVPR
jgi:hypothetical protein